MGPGRRAPDSMAEDLMIVVMRGWWRQYRTDRRHRKDVVAFRRLMDARAARRAA